MLYYSTTVPPKINQSNISNSPGNCLDLTQNLKNYQRIGIDLCVKAGPGAKLTLECEILEGEPIPHVKWLKDGKELVYANTSNKLTLALPTNANNTAKLTIEGNYTCAAINEAGIVSASSYVLLFGGTYILLVSMWIRCKTSFSLIQIFPLLLLQGSL